MKKLTLFLILTLSYFYGRSQTGDPAINIPSPNAMSLGVFGEFPANSSTGVPDISIPVYEVKFRNISIPIGLQYNTNLVKPDIHPGWVGLGWNLTAGGEITRVINDFPDDLYTTTSTGGPRNQGYYYNYNFFSGADNDWANSTKIQQATRDGLPIKSYQHVNDYQPDEFNFSFLGYSGSFYLDETKHWKVRSDKYLTIDFQDSDKGGLTNPIAYASIVPGFKKFTITDANGIKYIFGGADESIEYSAGMFTFQQYVPYEPITWHLTSIVLPNAEIINLTYKRGTAIISPQLYYYYSQGTNNKLRFVGSIILPSYITGIETKLEKVSFSSSPTTELKYNPSSFAYESALLNSANINWQNAENAYFSNPQQSPAPGPSPAGLLIILPGTSNISDLNSALWFKLDNIAITNKTTNTIDHTFEFNYTNDLNQRLKLLNLTIRGSNISAAGKTYNISYNTTNLVLPPYLSNMTDYWGYFNNTNPDYSSSSNFYASKAPNANALQAEVINSIISPTGGSVKYVFEPHTYSKEVDLIRYNPLLVYSSNVNAAGLRLKQAVSYDINNQLINSVAYFYTQNYSSTNQSGLSTGILGGKTGYSYSASGQAGYNTGVTLISNLPASHNNNGSNIAYSEVAQVLSDGSYTINKYSNFDNGVSGEYMDQAPYYINNPSKPISGAFTSKAFERGKLLSKSIYTNTNILLQKSTYDYQRVNQASGYVREYTLDFSGQTANNADGFQYNSYDGTAIKIFTYPYLLYQETAMNYAAGIQSLSQSQTYTLNPTTLNLTSQVTINSKNQTMESDYTYPTDMVNLGLDPSGVYSKMVNANVISPIVQTIKKINGVQEVLTRSDFINPSAGIYVPGTQSTQLQNNNIQAIAQYTAYDAQGNLLTKSKPNGIKESYQWGYNNSYPLAAIKNASVNPLTGTLFGSCSIPSSASSNSTSFTTNIGGNITLSMQSSPGNTYSLQYTLSGPVTQSGTLCVSRSAVTCANPESVTLSNMPAGTYTLSISLSGGSAATKGMNFSYPVSQIYSNGLTEFYYEGFEESTSAGLQTTGGHTGNNFTTTNTVSWTLPANGRTYVISYWYLASGVWKYSGEQPYTSNNYVMQTAGGYDDIRIYPKDAQMTTYTYRPLTGMTSSTDENGLTTFYEYDAFQRLTNIKDKDNNILKNYSYNYAARQSFTNVAKSGTYTPACATGYTSLPVTYNVQPGTYSSTISQDDADQQAQNDVNANGQAYANAHGACTLICTSGNCSGVDKKCINGTCETASKIYTSSVQNHGSLWTCTYHYSWSDGSISADYTETSSSQCINQIQ